MAITTLDGLVAGLAAGQRLVYFRPAAHSGGMAGRFVSFWTSDSAGGYPSVGVTPATGSGAAVSSSTQGALPFNAPGGGNKLYVVSAACNVGPLGMLYDRLVHTSGLSGVVTSAQTVNSAALTRHTTGEGVELWLEWYNNTGSTSRTASISYTNQAGTSGRTATLTIPSSCQAKTMIQAQLQSGDTGVRSVESVTLSASTGTGGNFGVTLLKRVHGPGHLALVSNSNVAVEWSTDPFTHGVVEIDSAACLCFAPLISSALSSATMTLGSVTLAEG